VSLPSINVCMRLHISRIFYISFTCLILHFLTACSSGGSASAVGDCTLGKGTNVTISGKVTFDLVPHDGAGALDYPNTAVTDSKGVTVEAVCNSVIATTTTDVNGNYSLHVPGETNNVFIRVNAEMKKPGAPAWDFTVVDNTRSKALYSMSGAKFNSSDQNSIRNLHADSGWTGASYGSDRVAAPFAILDTVYWALQKVLNEDALTVFPALRINWSVNNVPVDGNTSNGQIITSHFNRYTNEMFLLGAENNDTDEYDEHIIIHEWGHYFEHNFSRSDSIGGFHSGGERLDMRVAFGEGFGYAFAGIVTDNPVVVDSQGASQGLAGVLNVDNNNCLNPGWYSECSVWSILYDLYDSTNDSVDAVSLGFAPLYSVLVNEQKNTPALTSVFSFIHVLKTNNPSAAASVDTLVAGPTSSINTIIDEYGTGETNNAGSANVLPIYTSITASQTINSLCVSDDFKGRNIDGDIIYNENKLSSFRYLRLTVPQNKSYTITVDKSLSAGGPGDDPDIFLFQQGNVVDLSLGTQLNTETLTTNLTAGVTYVLQIYDDKVTYTEPPADDTCYTVNISG